MKKLGPRTLAILVLGGMVFLPACRDDDAESAGAGVLDGLARPQQGRSMRATSTMRVGELRRGPDGNRDAGERRPTREGTPTSRATGTTSTCRRARPTS
jgi:hypothetical protein